MDLASENRLAAWEALGSVFKGWALAAPGHPADGIALMVEGRRRWHETGARVAACWIPARIAQLYADSRDATFVERDANGKLINQTTGIFALGGATNDNEENYLIAKVNRMMGVVRIENQARI